jgi:hypothetical protein
MAAGNEEVNCVFMKTAGGIPSPVIRNDYLVAKTFLRNVERHRRLINSLPYKKLRALKSILKIELDALRRLRGQ